MKHTCLLNSLAIVALLLTTFATPTLSQSRLLQELPTAIETAVVPSWASRLPQPSPDVTPPPPTARSATGLQTPPPPPEAETALGADTETASTLEQAERAELDAAVADGEGLCDFQPMATWPGPDGYNYYGSTCTYDWADIASSGTLVSLGDDDYDGPFNIGFTFPFYGNTWTDFYISSNGHIDFGSGSSSRFDQCPLPNDSSPNNLIALLWDDLDPGDTNDPVYYQSFASCPVGSGQCLVVQYEDFCHYPGGSTCTKAGTFEAILYEDGTVLIQFEDAGGEEGSDSTTGIEGDNTAADHGLTYACNAASSLTDSLSIQFELLAVPNLSESTKDAPSVAAPGDLVTYTVSIVNSGIASATNTTMEDPIPTDTAFAYIVSPPAASYNAGEDQVEWSGTVTNGASIDVTFVVTASDSITCGASITNTAVITAPGTPSTVTVQATTGVWELVIFQTDLEADNGGFTGDGDWEWGTPTYPAFLGAHSGSNVWATVLDGPYTNRDDFNTLSRNVDLSLVAPGTLAQLQWYEYFKANSDYDYAEVLVNGTVVYDIHDQGSVDTGGWRPVAVDVTPYTGQSVELTFRFYATATVNDDGWYLDDITVVSCEPLPGLYLSPDTIEVQGCNGVTQTHTFNLSNWTGVYDNFLMWYTLNDPAYGTIDGPNDIWLAQGASTSFVITLTPELCLPNNLELAASVKAYASSTVYSDTSYITKTIVTGIIPEWQSAADTPQGTRYHAVAYHDGYLYQFGGETGWWAATDAVNQYDVANDTWATATAMITGAYGIDAVTIGDYIYVPGGNVSTVDAGLPGPRLNSLQVYSPTADSWSTAAPMPVALAYASAVAYNGKLYVIGGEDASGAYTDTLYIYDPAGDSWSTGASMAETRGYAAAAAIGGKIYVAGGFAGATMRDSLEIYDPAADSWSTGPALPKAWAPFGDGALNNRYFIAFNGGDISFDGTDTSYTCSQDAYDYDTQTEEWVVLPDLNRCLYGSQGAAASDTFYLVSGRTNEGGWHMATEVEYLEQCPVCAQMGWLDGHVYDYDDVSAPCTDATIRVEPGSLDVSVNASGYYTVALVPFDYDVSASAVGYPQPDGPYGVTVSDGVATTRDFTLDRPDIEVVPLSLSASAVAPGVETRYFTITNAGSYNLEYDIREVAAMAILNAMSEAQSAPGIEVEAELQAQMDADEMTGYLIYFRARPDLSPAFQMDWIERGRFVVSALQQTAELSQADVRAYLDEQGADYRAYWIANIVSVKSSSRVAFDSLLEFPEIEALRTHRHPILYEPEEIKTSSFSPMSIESNITHVGADQVWGMGITGEGIVVANIDTGVNYTHETLVNQYRGNLGTSFDHNYNWWDPALGGQDLVPNDHHDHGSHTMGVILGDDGDDDQIGMAPGATWIACQAFESGDDELLECGQFMAAPWDLTQSDPNSDLRPHVVNNSWGDCKDHADHWYDDTIDAWHALGIYPVFSNGNAGNCGYPYPPGCNTVGNPARAGNVTGVGSTGQSNGQYATHSNWGPTDDPDTVNPNGYPSLKPQVMAPGVNIRSAGNSGNEYVSMGGTSMSSPHVVGAIALMWSAAPCLIGDYAATETILQDTATPIPYDSGCGGEGPGNVPNMATGWGEINAYAAVQAALDYCGADQLPWLATDPVTGTLPTGDQVVEVTFTCDITASQQAQPLQGALRVLNNDPCEGPVDVVVDVTFFCIGQNPFPTWEKELWINGEEATPVAGPHTVRSGDTVVIVDQVGATFSETITSVLTETWSDSLELVDYDTSGVGSVTTGANTLIWNLTSVAPNTLYPITKTFVVQYGDWTTDFITESYAVEDALTQPDDIVVSFEHYVPAMTLDKTGPDQADNGEIISLTLTVYSDGNFRGEAVLTDTLPTGMTYTGNLTYTYGRAWEDGNVIHWTSYTTTMTALHAPMQDVEVLVLTPDEDHDISSLLTALGTCTGTNVTVWDADVGGNPSVADLLAYNVVFIGNDNRWFYGDMDKTIVGDNLADYIDQGGKVVEGMYVQSFDAWGLAGRYMTDGYSPFTSATQDSGDPDTMNIVSPTHPIMAGVTSVNDNWGCQDPGLRAGADLIADWSTSGYNYIAANRNVVALNQLLYYQANWTGDVDVILCNSIDYLMSQITPPMPAVVTITFDVQVTGSPGEVVRNLAELDWDKDYADDIHDVELIAFEPVCGFTSSSPDDLGETTYFTNTTTGTPPLTYRWDFGDDSPISAAENPPHAYAQAGLYTVSLTSTNLYGQDVCSGTVSIEGPPLAGFTSNSPVVLGNPVVFANTTLAYPAVTAWLWDFGDGLTSTLETPPAHDYAAADTYTVTLNATNAKGNDTYSDTVLVQPVCEPVTDASFTYDPSEPEVAEVVAFDAVYTPTTATSPVTLTWDFGGGVIKSGVSVTHTYAISNTYAVTLTVFNECTSPAVEYVGYVIVVKPETCIYLPLVMRSYP